MIPSRRLVMLAALLTVPLLLSSVNRTIADIGLLLNVVLAAVAMLDLLISPGPEGVELRRVISEVLSVAASNPATMQVRNRSSFPLALTIHDDAGPYCVVGGLPQTL